MKKNIFLYSLLCASLGLNLYFINSELIVVDSLDDSSGVKDQVRLAQSAIKKSQINLNKNKEKNVQKIKKQILDSGDSSPAPIDENIKEDFSNSDYEREYEKAKSRWQEDMRTYLERDMGILPEYVDEYFDLAVQRDKEISEVMQSHYENNANQDETYIFTVEDNIHLAKVNKKYLEKLKNLFGEQAYQEYVKYRNESVKRMIQNGSGFMVEF